MSERDVLTYVQPVYDPIMRQLENKLIDNSINPDSPRHNVHRRIRRVRKDKVLGIEVRQIFLPNATSKYRDVVNIGLRDHSSHRKLHIALTKFILAMLVPNSLEIKVRTIEKWLQEGQASSMRQASRRSMVLLIARQHPLRVFLSINISIALDCSINSWSRALGLRDNGDAFSPR